jgi:oxygen-independent coproporphyrinogen-3 oxidase
MTTTETAPEAAAGGLEAPAVAPRPEPATAGLAGEDTGVGSVFVSNYPPYSAWSADAVPAVERLLAAPAAEPAAPLGLYLHIPFCRRRCKFCYFRVYTDKNSDEIGRYTEALAREVELYGARPAVAGRPLAFVYFGGGTPSFVSVRHLEELAARLRAALPWERVEEVTFECEPGTLTASKVRAIQSLGVTRLSLGIESFDDDILRGNGRAHVSKEIYRCLPWIAEAGFDQLNVDLIAGMVGESEQSWRATVDKTLEIEPDSVTVYQLELPFNARFSQQVLAGTFERPLATWADKRAWHGWAFERFEQAGYEVSSAYTVVKKTAVKKRPREGRSRFPGRFLYRDALWHGGDLLGTGVASFSHLQGLHFQNEAGWLPYLEGVESGRLPIARAFAAGPDDLLRRELILQLKLGRVETEPFRRRFGVDVLERFAPAFDRLAAAGMLAVRRDGGGAIELTREGLLRVDTLLPELYDERYRGGRYT